MKDEQHIINLTLAELLPLIQQCRGENYRLVQIHATTLKDGRVEVNYSMDIGDALDTIRIILEENDQLPSVSTYYPAAAFYENEIKDLFGVYFSDINLDYNGNFYRIAPKTPFAPIADQAAKEE